MTESASRRDGPILTARDFHGPARKRFLFYHTINHLNRSFLGFYGLRRKEPDQYPAILSSRLVKKVYLLYG